MRRRSTSTLRPVCRVPRARRNRRARGVTFAFVLALGISSGTTQRSAQQPGLQRRLPDDSISTFRVAITIDDVPWHGPWPGDTTLALRTSQLQDALRRYRAPVAAFVNCRGNDPRVERVIRQWERGGATIGNHTTGHRDLHRAPLIAWAAAVRDCDRTLRMALGHPIRFFRFPLLHQGATAEQRDTATAVMRQLGYQNAHVTIDNSDYIIAPPYRAAVERGDTLALRDYSRLMLRHDLDAVRHFRVVSTGTLGRQYLTSCYFTRMR